MRTQDPKSESIDQAPIHRATASLRVLFAGMVVFLLVGAWDTLPQTPSGAWQSLGALPANALTLSACWVLAALFVLTYVAVVLEDLLAISRAWLASWGAVAMLLVLAHQWHWSEFFVATLAQSSERVGGLLLFLLAVMGVVQWMSHEGGFYRVLQALWSPHPRVFLLGVSVLSFFLSAILDNMTTCLLMLTLIKGRLPEGDMRWRFAGMVVVAANAGGVWSPLGDVTSTMLWLGQKVSAYALLTQAFWPSVLHCAIVLLMLLWGLPTTWAPSSAPCQAQALKAASPEGLTPSPVESAQSLWVFGLGLAAMVSIPGLTWLSDATPAVCALGVLAFLCVGVSPVLHLAQPLPRTAAMGQMLRHLAQIDLASVCFIGAILMCMEALGQTGLLGDWAHRLQELLHGPWNTVWALGLLSAVVDNIPLVSAGMQMFDPRVFPKDDSLWVLLSYCAGTGGSLLIVGSAAGLVAMGQVGLKFNWYVLHFSARVLLAYIAGAAFVGVLSRT